MEIVRLKEENQSYFLHTMINYGRNLTMISNEQKKYLKSIKVKKFIIISIQLFIVFIFFALWEYLANKNIINTFVFSKPSKIFDTIINLAINNNLFTHIFTTLYEVIIAFTLGIFLGLIVSIILYQFLIIAKIV